MSQDDADKLSEVIPKSLNSIIRKNQAEMQLEYASSQDLSTINMVITEDYYKGSLWNAFIYKRIVSGSKQQTLYLVGYMQEGRQTVAWHTSYLIGFDTEAMVVSTASGSLYHIESFAEGEADAELLINVCAILHRDGLGEHFGVPHFFY